MAKNDFDELMSIGIDIGKDTFLLVGFDSTWWASIRQGSGSCGNRSNASL